MQTLSSLKNKKILLVTLTLIFLLMSVFFPKVAFAGIGNIDDGVHKKLNLNLLLMYDADQENIDAWEETFNRTSELLYNSTEGQMQIGEVNVYINDIYAIPIADVWVLEKDGGVANANIEGLGGIGRILLHQEDKDNEYDSKGYVTIVHEMGHYVFGLYDEYMGYVYDGNKWVISEQENFAGCAKCTGNSSSPACLMDASRKVNNHRTEWCTPINDEKWNTEHNQGCNENGKTYKNVQEYIKNNSCWETIVDICKDKYKVILTMPTSEPSTTLPSGHEDINWNIMNGELRAVIAIDKTIRTMYGDNIELAKLGGNIFVDLLYSGEKVGVVSFSSHASVDFPLQKIVDLDQKRLTNNPGYSNAYPSFSPDGFRIAYSHRYKFGGDQQIYIMNKDGSQKRLLASLGNNVDFSFSPDGTKIVFVSDRDGNKEIYIMNASTGSGQTRLTDNSGVDYSPVFSPDGTKIAFESNRDGNTEIYIMNVDGSEQTRLTESSGDNYSPFFSPDGSKIAFISTRDQNPEIYGPTEIYIMNTDGSEQTNLTMNSTARDISTCFSPDGSKIVFASDRDGNTEIYVMDADGKNKERLTYNESNDTYCSFSPDGTKIVFASERDESMEIYIMNADGSCQTRHTYNSSYDGAPCFSPGGDKVAFESFRDQNNEIYITNVDMNMEGVPKEAAKMAINAISTIDETTDIESGLRTSLNQIVRAGEYSGDEFIVLLSGGPGGDPGSVISDLQERGVRVFAIGLGDYADIKMLRSIADKTKGKFFFASSAKNLPSIFAKISAEMRGSAALRTIKDFITPSSQTVENVFVDSFSKEATFFLEWEGSDLDLTLIRPNGTVINRETAQTDPNIKYVERDTYEFYCINEPMAGEWQLIIDAIDVSSEEPFTIQVLGEAMGVLFEVCTDKVSYVYPENILIQSHVIAIDYVANAEVTGTVEIPDGSIVDITLFDDGLASHGDEFPNDGVYSNFFSEYTEDGVYTFNMVVDNKGGIQAFLGEIPPEGWAPTPIDPFTRESSVSVSVSGVTSSEKLPTELTLDFPSNIQYSDMLSGSATLTSLGTVLENMEVEFGCMLQIETLITDEAGEVYSTPYKVEEQSSTSADPICVNFYGDDNYLPGYSEQYITVEKEDASIIYNGDTIVEVGNPVTLSCGVSEEEDSSPGDITLAGPVTFSLSTEEGFNETYTAAVGSDGVATTTEELPVGLYKIIATIDSDYYTAPPSEEAILAVYDPSGSFVTGGGWFIPEGSTAKVNFGFKVKYKKDGTLNGNLEIIDHSSGTNYKANDFTFLVISANKAYFSGNLEVDGEGLYSFTAVMEDNGSPGKDNDRFSIDILMDGEHIVFDKLIDNGNIVIH